MLQLFENDCTSPFTCFFFTMFSNKRALVKRLYLYMKLLQSSTIFKTVPRLKLLPEIFYNYQFRKYNRSSTHNYSRLLINFFIPLRLAEAITQESNQERSQWNPGSTREGSRFARMTLFICNSRIKFMENLQHCRDPVKMGDNFIPVNRDHVIIT